MLAMGTPDGFSSTSLRSSFSLSGFGPILQYWESIYTAFSSPSAFVSSLGSFQPIDANGSINWGKVVFLTTCFAAMAGCGFLSSMLRRTSTKRLQESRRFRRSAHKNYSKASAETMTSSEDEDYDSNGSLRHGTEGALCEKEAAPKHREESADGMFLLSPVYKMALTVNSSYYGSWTLEEAFLVHFLYNFCRYLPVYQNILLSTPSDEQISHQTISGSVTGVCTRFGWIPGTVQPRFGELVQHRPLLRN